MKITAITRYKHGELYAILQRIGWTQSELSRQTGIHVATIGSIINLVKRPTLEQADAIQKAFGTAGEYFDVLAEWPETFEGIKRGYKLEQTADVKMENLIGCQEAMMLPAPEAEDTTELDAAIENVIGSLSETQQAVLKEVFWGDKNFSEIGRKYKVYGQTIHQTTARALRKLRHPARIKKLEPYLPFDVDSYL